MVFVHTGKFVCYAEDLRRGACDARELLAYFKRLLSHWRRLAWRKSEALKLILSTRIMCRAELLFYYVPYVLLLPVIKRYNCCLDFEKHKGLLGSGCHSKTHLESVATRQRNYTARMHARWLSGYGATHTT